MARDYWGYMLTSFGYSLLYWVYFVYSSTMIGNLAKVLDFNRLFLEFYTSSYVTIHWFGHACTRTWSNYHKKVAIKYSPPKSVIEVFNVVVCLLKVAIVDCASLM